MLLCSMECFGQQSLVHSSTNPCYLSGVRSPMNPSLTKCPNYVSGSERVNVEAGRKGKASHACLPIAPTSLQKLQAVWLNS